MYLFIESFWENQLVFYFVVTLAVQCCHQIIFKFQLVYFTSFALWGISVFDSLDIDLRDELYYYCQVVLPIEMVYFRWDSCVICLG